VCVAGPVLIGQHRLCDDCRSVRCHCERVRLEAGPRPLHLVFCVFTSRLHITSGSLTEMLLALAVIGLPLQPNAPSTTYGLASLRIRD